MRQAGGVWRAVAFSVACSNSLSPNAKAALLGALARAKTSAGRSNLGQYTRVGTFSVWHWIVVLGVMLIWSYPLAMICKKAGKAHAVGRITGKIGLLVLGPLWCIAFFGSGSHPVPAFHVLRTAFTSPVSALRSPSQLTVRKRRGGDRRPAPWR
jgi:hypothetical protein